MSRSDQFESLLQSELGWFSMGKVWKIDIWLKVWLEPDWLKIAKWKFFIIHNNPQTSSLQCLLLTSQNQQITENFVVYLAKKIHKFKPKKIFFFHPTNRFMLSCWLLIRKTFTLLTLKNEFFHFFRYFAMNNFLSIFHCSMI